MLCRGTECFRSTKSHPLAEACPRDMNTRLCLLQDILFSSPEPRPGGAPASVTMQSVASLLVYRRRLKGQQLTSDLSSLTHPIYVFLGSPVTTATTLRQSRMTARELYSQTRATTQ